MPHIGSQMHHILKTDLSGSLAQRYNEYECDTMRRLAGSCSVCAVNVLLIFCQCAGSSLLYLLLKVQHTHIQTTAEMVLVATNSDTKRVALH